MNILFDLFTTQIQVGGSAEYVRRVFYSVLEYTKQHRNGIKILGFVDSSLGKWSYSDLTPESLASKNIQVLDYAQTNLKEIISQYKINKIFIGCGQFWGNRFDVENITCPCVCVLHDLQDEEFHVNKIQEYLSLNNLWRFTKLILNRRIRGNRSIKRLPPLFELAKINSRLQFVSVSNYSRNSIVYNFSYPKNKIAVLYSPERLTESKTSIENWVVKNLVEKNVRYFLMLSANRPAKNADKVFSAFERFQELTGEDVYIVTTGYKQQRYKHHIPMPYLSDSDLEHVVCNSYALIFPSFFEGFGYPAVEAMKYGKPVLSSNVTSMPEILGDAPIYFSPLYETDIFSAFCKFNEDNYESRSLKSSNQYAMIHQKQENDLSTLVELLTSY